MAARNTWTLQAHPARALAAPARGPASAASHARAFHGEIRSSPSLSLALRLRLPLSLALPLEAAALSLALPLRGCRRVTRAPDRGCRRVTRAPDRGCRSHSRSHSRLSLSLALPLEAVGRLQQLPREPAGARGGRRVGAPPPARAAAAAGERRAPAWGALRGPSQPCQCMQDGCNAHLGAFGSAVHACGAANEAALSMCERSGQIPNAHQGSAMGLAALLQLL